MAFSTLVLIIISILGVILEAFLQTSHLHILYNLKIVYIITLLLLYLRRNRIALLYLLCGSVIVEIFNYNIVGLSAFVFGVSVLAANLINRFAVVISDQGRKFNVTLILAIGILGEYFLTGLAGGTSTLMNPIVILFNIFLLVIGLQLIDKFTAESKYVYKK